ncbi:MAG: cation diffusion facilitator family transporter [Prevotella sp.]|jgi:cation diffusion facilitator family transporter|nr:cation diffusion facilitator family transporter [Prevotella sp.]MCI1684160.1 cation diffusion facilitator family transporter [Prevotella sp.]MCI1781674.1 cation diffusion facilitator family transporter [Prevotella sp.]MCI1802779.1 cation diffusion facilitator family transporter [Prevotella sp.]MCI1816065.1 cation diffusion facilitator family transporter [Prevotella sp.]MCI1848647.1 cation diffusion facilitator family transporter [Prevotella sp.]
MTSKKKAALTSIIAAVFLTTMKFIVGILTSSMGIISEALHSLLDLLAAVITFVSVSISDKPADKEHQYGHGKIENLSAFFESILLVITCVWIIYEAISRLISGNTAIRVTVWSYLVVLTAMAVDIGRSRMLFKVAKRDNSQALEADAIHFSTDILSSGVVLLGLICANFGYHKADAISALGVAVIVLGISYRLGKRAIDVLLDKVPDGLTEKVESRLKSNKDIVCYHDLKIRVAGPDTFVEVNVHIHPHTDLETAHCICSRIEKDIASLIPRCTTVVHAEPDNG